MSVISMMEMNPKSPFLWDWDNLVILNTKTIEGIEGFEAGSYFSSGTHSDIGYASSSRTSKSASVESSPDKHNAVITTNELVNYGQTQTSSTIESSVVSGESLIALELGKRTYFEDVSGVSNVKNGAKKSKLSGPHSDVPLCQVDGCDLDLSNAKEYHRKHKVCDSHAKCPRVVINGLEKRFCQQCSRFHGLTEFDQKKRSCRRRLSDHNARRRKPKPEIIQFNSMRLPPLLYEDRNLLSFGFDQSRHDMWEVTHNSKVTVTKPSLLTTVKTGGTDELDSTQNGLQTPEMKVPNVSMHLLPSKGSSFETYHRGTAISVKPSNMEAAAQVQQRALSLLSTTSWGSSEATSILGNQPSLSHPFPMTTAQPQPLPVSAAEYWQVEEPASTGLGLHGSAFQLFKPPSDPSFYLY